MNEEFRWDLPELPPPQLPRKKFDYERVEKAIKVQPENLSFRLDAQERSDIEMHDQLRDLTKSAVAIGIIALIAIVI